MSKRGGTVKRKVRMIITELEREIQTARKGDKTDSWRKIKNKLGEMIKGFRKRANEGEYIQRELEEERDSYWKIMN